MRYKTLALAHESWVMTLAANYELGKFMILTLFSGANSALCTSARRKSQVSSWRPNSCWHREKRTAGMWSERWTSCESSSTPDWFNSTMPLTTAKRCASFLSCKYPVGSQIDLFTVSSLKFLDAICGSFSVIPIPMSLKLASIAQNFLVCYLFSF